MGKAKRAHQGLELTNDGLFLLGTGLVAFAGMKRKKK
jgi:hypothetical protein